MKRFVYGMSVWVGLCAASAPVAMAQSDAETFPRRIVVVGLSDNVKSNYFYDEWIAEETGIAGDSLDWTFNAIIMEHLVNGSSSGCVFVPASEVAMEGGWTEAIAVHGEGEGSYSDLSSVSPADWAGAVKEAGASYVLVLNQHYLQWQETPLRTLFHIVSYSLFDREGKEVCRGNPYFTSMNLEGRERLRKISQKASHRMASDIINRIK
jgi:hypothetical protein